MENTGTLTVNEMIQKLESFRDSHDGNGELPIYIYVIGDVPTEEPVEIDSIDFSISDRVDINITE